MILLYGGIAILLLVLVAGHAAFAVSAEGAQPNAPTRADWLNQDKFGLFIHWGLYSALARDEWVMHREQIPVATYAKLAETFNPAAFDADAWVAVAKNAGMKYLTITAKHHEGFCLYGSDVDDYNLVHGTPFGRDVLAELKTACDTAGIRFGLYYSHVQDWYHAGGSCNGPKWDPTQDGTLRTYLDTVAIPQIKELLTRYQPAHLWFDTPHDMTPEIARELVGVVRAVKPDTLINSRLLCQGFQVETLTKTQLDELRGIGVDYLSYPDRTIPANSPWACWETCMTLNESWGYKANDNDWKSPQKVIQQLVEVVSKGGAFLLNLGPTAAGEISPQAVDVLAQVGDWLRVNGDAVYGAAPTPLKGDGCAARSWLATGKEDTLYIHLIDWPNGPLVVQGVPAKVITASWLGRPDSASFTFAQEGSALTIDLPDHPPGGPVPVLILTLTAA